MTDFVAIRQRQRRRGSCVVGNLIQLDNRMRLYECRWALPAAAAAASAASATAL